MFLSPIFDSISKSNYTSAFDMEVLKQASAHGIIDKRVMALGGITTENMAVAKDFGFGGVVVLGDLWNRFNIHSTLDYKELINHFRKLRKAADWQDKLLLKLIRYREMSANNSFMVFSGTKSKYLAEKICSSLGCPLANWWLPLCRRRVFRVIRRVYPWTRRIPGTVYVSELRQFNGTPADDRCGQTCFG